MKLPLLFACTFSIFQLSAQEYEPLLNEDHTWKQLVYGWTTFGQEIKIEGDTAIGEFTYKKIYAATEPLWDDWYLQGAYREDVAEQTIYKWNGTFDDLVYKFSVEEGDIFTISPMGFPTEMLVSSVGTTTVNGNLRKTISFEYEWYTEVWIEGVGSSLGVLNPATNFPDFNPVLTCFYVANNLAYDNPNEDTDCDLFLSVDTEELSSLNAFPNPSTGKFRLSVSPELTFMPYEIIDARGSVVQKSNGNTEGKEVDLTGFSDGMYYLKFIVGQKTVKVIPLVKQTDFGEK
jgi:hypothetical protein